MNDSANSNLVSGEIAGRIGAVYLGEAEASGVHDQLQQTAKGLSPDREIRTTLMAPESIKGRGGEPEV